MNFTKTTTSITLILAASVSATPLPTTAPGPLDLKSNQGVVDAWKNSTDISFTPVSTHGIISIPANTNTLKFFSKYIDDAPNTTVLQNQVDLKGETNDAIEIINDLLFFDQKLNTLATDT